MTLVKDGRHSLHPEDHAGDLPSMDRSSTILLSRRQQSTAYNNVTHQLEICVSIQTKCYFAENVNAAGAGNGAHNEPLDAQSNVYCWWLRGDEGYIEVHLPTDGQLVKLLRCVCKGANIRR